MRASSSSSVGTKCGAEDVRVTTRASKRSLIRLALFWAFRRAHSRSPTRFNAWWALSGSLMMGHAGKPTARLAAAPTGRDAPAETPKEPNVSVSAWLSFSGMSRTRGRSLIVNDSAIRRSVCAGTPSASGAIPPAEMVVVDIIVFFQ